MIERARARASRDIAYRARAAQLRCMRTGGDDNLGSRLQAAQLASPSCRRQAAGAREFPFTSGAVNTREDECSKTESATCVSFRLRRTKEKKRKKIDSVRPHVVSRSTLGSQWTSSLGPWLLWSHGCSSTIA